jgi:hypothetical protein
VRVHRASAAARSAVEAAGGWVDLLEDHGETTQEEPQA